VPSRVIALATSLARKPANISMRAAATLERFERLRNDDPAIELIEETTAIGPSIICLFT
jgi:hypothetical protein